MAKDSKGHGSSSKGQSWTVSGPKGSTVVKGQAAANYKTATRRGSGQMASATHSTVKNESNSAKLAAKKKAIAFAKSGGFGRTIKL